MDVNNLIAVRDEAMRMKEQKIQQALAENNRDIIVPKFAEYDDEFNNTISAIDNEKRKAYQVADDKYNNNINTAQNLVSQKKDSFRTNEENKIKARVSAENDTYINALNELIDKFGG